MAPEIKNGEIYNGNLVDIFSAGVVIFCLVTGIFPFKEASTSCSYFSLLAAKKYYDYWKVINKYSKHPISDEFKSLMEKMLALNPLERPVASEIKNKIWLSEEEDMIISNDEIE